MLYVFLHGLTVVCDRGSQIEIVMPRVRGHVYKAGSWLLERPIESGATLQLLNVPAGHQSTRGTGFLIEVPPQYKVTRRGRAATILVPKPDEVLGILRATDTVNHAATLNTPNPAHFDSLAEVLILVYQQANETQVALDGHYWEPYATQGGISLHFVATSEEMEGKQHYEDTERALREVFFNYPGITYNERAPVPVPPPWRDPAHPHFGDLGNRTLRGSRVFENQTGNLAFELAELEHPSLRADRLERVGRSLREGLPIGDAWHRPDPTGGRLGPCGTMSGT
jgi:hypothetical protein